MLYGVFPMLYGVFPMLYGVFPMLYGAFLMLYRVLYLYFVECYPLHVLGLWYVDRDIWIWDDAHDRLFL